MSKYEIIKEKSKDIDWSNSDISNSIVITFPVPEGHPRHTVLKKYSLVMGSITDYKFSDNYLILCDTGVVNSLSKNIITLDGFVTINPTENKLKTLEEAKKFAESCSGKGYAKVVVIGGGVLINFGGYIAESLNIDLVYIPTTIIAISDASIGGKVRINDIQDKVFIKHAHKTFYEPSEIILDPCFLDTHSDEQIKIGLAEIIKHAVYQSPRLAGYIISDEFDPFSNKESLTRAILWTADLKRVCLEVDPEETPDGAALILRAAHNISDKLEEKSEFTLPHGKAVEEAMTQDLYSHPDQYKLLVQIYNKLSIDHTKHFQSI